MARRKLFNNFIRFQPDKKPSDRSDLPIVDKGKDLISELDATTITSVDQLNQFRNLSDDRQTQYNAYDEMKSDSIIAAALELYADDATQYDEQGRVIWVESDSDEITKAANRLIEILDLPERAWKHIYQTCLYGDYYLKLYRRGDVEEEDEYLSQRYKSIQTRIVNDTKVTSRNGKEVSEKILGFEEYVEDVEDPALLFDLRKRGKSAGFIEIGREVYMNQVAQIASTSFTFQTTDISVYPPDRFVHIMLSENLSRTPEEVQIDLGDGKVATYQSARGKSMLQDVYPIQKELQLLEDSLLLNRLTRSSLIRLLEIEVGDMPKQEVNPYLRRIKNLIEQHISMDKSNGDYKSYNAPGPIDNVIYIPTRNGKGSITVNNLGGDVNVRDIADIDYFNNKRAGALKIPRAYLGDDMDGCLRGETKLLLLNGQHRSIKYLYENRDEYLGKGIMSCNCDGSLVPTTITDIKLTRKSATFVRVHLDNGEYFDVTEDHLCMLRDGTFQWADDLKPGDSLMPLYDEVRSGRRYVWDNKEESWKAQYRLVALYKYGELLKGHQVHHLNERKIDDDFTNLEQILTSDHCKIHSKMLHEKSETSRQELKEKDPEKYYQIYGAGGRAIKGIKRSQETRDKISNALKGKPSNHPFEKGDLNPSHFMTEDTRKKISKANSGRKHTEETKKKIGDAHRGKVVSESTCRKLSENHADVSGKNNPMYGKSVEWTDERKAEQSKRLQGSGNPCYGKKLCNNGVINKYISSDTLEEFLLNNPDWSLGSLKKNKAPYNHKVVKVERLDVVEDAYDIEVANESHTFILDAGVFVHNSGLSNGGSLTRLSARYARTIKRIQTAYIRAITHLLNLFFIEKKLDYVNKFKVRMTSPSTQEDLERNELIGGNIDIVSSILDLTSSLEGSTQKKVLSYLVSNIMKMPEISQMIDEDVTPEEDVDIEGAGSPGGPDLNIDFGGESPSDEIGVETETPETPEEPSSTEGGFSDEDFSEFEDTL